MKLVEKKVSRATENTLLQIETAILISSITGLVLDVLAVFLIFQSDTKKWGVILLLVVLLPTFWYHFGKLKKQPTHPKQVQ